MATEPVDAAPAAARVSLVGEALLPALRYFDASGGVRYVVELQSLQVELLRLAEPERRAELLPGLELAAPVQTVIASVQAPSLSEFVRALDHRSIQTQLDQLRSHWKMSQGPTVGTLEVATGVSAGLSVGYVVWLLRGGVLMGSMLSALPAWQMIDPLPILSRGLGAREREGDDEEGVESLFRRRPDAAMQSRGPVPSQVHPDRSGNPAGEGGEA